MWEFLPFLNAPEKKILKIAEEINYGIEENTPLCLLGENFFGFLKKKQKVVVICTENAKRYGGYNFARNHSSEPPFVTGLMIRRAVRHEAVHIAQQCNEGILNIAKEKNLTISPYKLNALKGSVSLTGNEEEEYEAYTLEDHPRLIIAALKKFCF